MYQLEIQYLLNCLRKCTGWKYLLVFKGEYRLKITLKMFKGVNWLEISLKLYKGVYTFKISFKLYKGVYTFEIRFNLFKGAVQQCSNEVYHLIITML